MTTTLTSATPRIATRQQWLAARKALLAKEKAMSGELDSLRAERRKLPMVRIDKTYVFEGPNGERTLGDLFQGRRQLIIYHFMFDPAWDEGCRGCSFVADHFAGALIHLAQRDTSLAVISRAPIEKIERFKARMGWDFPWLSSFKSDFNYDFHATVDEEHPEANYQSYYPIAHDMAAKFKGPPPGEIPGLSVFLRDGGEIYHTYSTFLRGLELLLNTYNLLDQTPLGRQEDERGLAGWVRHHDRY